MTEKPLSECRVLVTPTSFGKADPSLKSNLEAACGQVVYNETGKLLDASQLKELIHGIDGYVAGLDEINRAVLEAADSLRVIARYGVGVDRVDLAAAKERGIIVTNTPGANSVSVAELAVALMLSVARGIPDAVAATRAGAWPRTTGITLRNKTVGIVGYGAIGRCVAERLRPFGCRLLAYDPFPPKDPGAGIEMTELQALLGRSDIVSLHAPVTETTRRMADDRFFAQMKPGALLVNTARGELIDEAALLRALNEGRLTAAALDVFEQEPLPVESPLLQSQRIIATPHMAAHTDDAMNAMARMAAEDCLAVLQGSSPQHPVQ